MYRFWDSVIKPLLCIVNPNTIIEIGSYRGRNTVNLLGFVQDHGGIVHVVDPLPKYNIDKYKDRYGESLVFHRERSLDALPKIERMDVVLIDGDHNWYTVYNELKLIENYARKFDTRFPLVLLHDIGWPYGRRDLYYDPESIPSEYRKPYDTKGIRPGRTKLQDEGGLNPDLCNAIYENGLRNGVLSAVEDFKEQGGSNYELVQIPAIFGLGILFSSEWVQSNGELAKWLASMKTATTVWPIVEMVERERVCRQIEASERRQELQKQKKVINDLEEQIIYISNQSRK